MTTTATPDTPCQAYMDMHENWTLLHDLRGGTRMMRSAGKKWLPQEPNEEPLAYANRLERSFLFSALNDTIDKLVAKPFSAPVKISDNVPPELDGIEDDVDHTGKSLDFFLREIFDSAAMYGITHVLVDYPNVGGEVLTKEEEAVQQLRPTFVHIRPPDMIGWQTRYTPSGAEELTAIRFKEVRTEPDGDFGEKQVTYIRHYTTTEWFIYKQEAGKWNVYASGMHTFGRVPLFSMYFNRSGFMRAVPPLMDLAWMNLVHWQSYSDHRNILRFARVGLIFISGLTPEEMADGITIGPGRIIRSRNDLAKMAYVEHSGKAIDAGVADLKAIEDKMEALGNQPLMSRTGNQTATGQAIDEARTQCDLKSWVRIAEDFAEDLYEAAAEWMGIEMPEDFCIDINDEFGNEFVGGSDSATLLQMRTARELSRETYLTEIRRRGIIADNVDIAEEIGRIEAEGPALSAMAPPTPPPDKQPAEPGETPEPVSTDETKETVGEPTQPQVKPGE